MSESEVVPCLLRVGENIKKYKLFRLNNEKVTIGRSGEVTFAILSPMISRCHSTIHRKGVDEWTIQDNKSLNGVYVNGRKLAPLQPTSLNDGDMVQFGIPTETDRPAEFIYKFHSALKIRVEKKNKRQRCDEASCSQKTNPIGNESFEEETEMKRKSCILQQSKENSFSEKMRQQMEVSQAEQKAREAEYEAKLQEMQKMLEEREKNQKEVQEQLQEQLERERAEKENQAKEVESLRLKEAAILLEMEDKQKQLEKEKEELRLKMQAELEVNLKEREAALLGQLAAQKDALLEEKRKVEESLQKEMEKAIEEKNKELETQLTEQRAKLDKVIEKKEMEQKMLEHQLNETKEESESHKMNALKAKEEVLISFVDLMEEELECSICNELFIKATSLNCSHAFCSLCIKQWMKVKKECPNCRQPITSTMQSINLDNYIEKMVDQLNADLKERRKKLIEDRKVEEEKFLGKTAPAAGPSAPGGTATPGVTITGFQPGPAVIIVGTDEAYQPPPAPRRGGRNRRPSARGAARGAAARGAAALRGAARGAAGRGAAARGAVAMGTVVAGPGARGAAIVGNYARTRIPLRTVVAGPAAGGAAIVGASARLQASIDAVARDAVGRGAARGVIVAGPAPRGAAVAAAAGTGLNAQMFQARAEADAARSIAEAERDAAAAQGLLEIQARAEADAARNFAQVAQNTATTTATTTTEVTPSTSSYTNPIRLDDDSSDLEDISIRPAGRRPLDSDSDSSDSVEGEGNAYYGGYGRCYNCGSRGHWANGCPY